MNQSKTTKNTDKLCELIYNEMQKGYLNNASLVQIIELCSSLLNLQTISQYAKTNNLSYNGVKNNREVKKINGVPFVIDND